MVCVRGHLGQSHKVSGRRITIEQFRRVPEDEDSTMEEAEVSIETKRIQETGRTQSRPALNVCCMHQRMIDDVLTRDGRPTGKVRCLECEAIFDDPYKSKRLK